MPSWDVSDRAIHLPHDPINFLAINDKIMIFLEQSSDGTIAVDKLVLHTELFYFLEHFISLLRLLAIFFPTVEG